MSHQSPTKWFISVISGLLFCIATTLHAKEEEEPLTLQEILYEYCEAQGGIREIEKVQSIRLQGKIRAQEQELPFIQTKKQPNLVRLVMSKNKLDVTWGYNGTVAWQQLPNRKDTTPIPADAAKGFIRDAQLFSHLVYAAQGREMPMSLLGETEVGEKKAYHIRIELDSDEEIEYFLDTETFLELKTISTVMEEGKTVHYETFFSDYKEVDGLTIPHLIESFKDGEKESSVEVSKVKINVGVFNQYFDPVNLHAASQ